MLNDRKTSILKLIVEDYISTGQPVASKQLVERYQLALSSATIRNIMAELADLGYLHQPHTSAGRIPLYKAYRVYLESLSDETQNQEDSDESRAFSVVSGVEDATHRHIVNRLSELTSQLALLSFPQRNYLSGIANFLENPEFTDIDQLAAIFRILEIPEATKPAFIYPAQGHEVVFLIGNENYYEQMNNCTFVYMNYPCGSVQGYLGIVSPLRLDYHKTLDVFTQLTANL